MRRSLVVLLLTAAALPVRAQTQLAAAREVPRILMPGTPVGQAPAAMSLVTPAAPTLSLAAAPALIVPAAPVILAPEPMIVPASRALTEAEAAPAKLPSESELRGLAKSLAPAGGKEDSGAADAERARSLDASFDGKLAPEASAWSGVSADFARGPLAPGLPAVETAARSLIARLLPSLYRRVPVAAAYDRGPHPATGHTWTPERGHVVELAPVRADSRGEVASAFGAPGALSVQQKIEHLLEFAHEYFHVLFDSAVGREENHPSHSAYAALTEGFAVSGEQLLIKRLLDLAPELSLAPRDAMDLAAIARERSRWLDVEDNHYSEGVLSWRKAYETGGTDGLLHFLTSLSARRMMATPRSDPAYQLALGEPGLLAGYLGRDEASPARRELEAFAKAARGEVLTDAETRDAAAAVERAGAEGRRRLFERTLFADRRLTAPAASAAAGAWYEKKAAAPVSVEPAFAAARLSPAAGAELARLLAETVAAPGGAARLFGRPGPNDALNAIAGGAEKLPWDEAGRRTWNRGLMRWLTGAR